MTDEQSKSFSAQNSMQELRQFAEQCQTYAQEISCQGFEIFLSDSVASDVQYRCQKLESVDLSGDFIASIKVTHNNRVATATVSERSPAALRQALDNALEICAHTEADPCYGLPEPDQICGEEDMVELNTYSDEEIDMPAIHDLAKTCEQAGFDHDKRIVNSEGAQVSANRSVGVFANSHGAILANARSEYALHACLLAKEGDSQESYYHFSRAHSPNLLQNPREVGAEAARQAISRLHPRQPKTMTCPVIFSANIAGGFLGHLLEANDGSSIKRGESFLIDKVGQMVAAKHLSLREKPHLERGLASRCFDSEGVRTRENVFVSEGRLQTHSLDSYHARYLKQATTGNCGGFSNIEVSRSAGLSEEDLLAEAGRGLLVTDLIGFGVNLTTGDYSRGASGFWFEDGKIQYPVNECTIAARLQDAYSNIVAIADNVWPHSSIMTGSILVNTMTVGGV